MVRRIRRWIEARQQEEERRQAAIADMAPRPRPGMVIAARDELQTIADHIYSRVIELEEERAAPPVVEDPPTRKPSIQAEALLQRIIPGEDYLALAADGQCTIKGERFQYRLRRNQKTIVIKEDGEYSSCIHLSDSQAPDTDRLVAEYLLITNDEAEYLRTANLTRIKTAAYARDVYQRTYYTDPHGFYGTFAVGGPVRVTHGPGLMISTGAFYSMAMTTCAVSIDWGTIGSAGVW